MNGNVSLVIDDSNITGNQQGLAVLGPNAAKVVAAMVTNTNIVNNDLIGIVATDTAIVRVSGSTITGKTRGIDASRDRRS